MKHVPLALLALAAALVIAPTAMANSLTYDFSFSSTTSNATQFIDGSGVLTVDSTTNAITGITGTITDTIDGLTVPINGLIAEPSDTFTFLGATYTFDDMLIDGVLGSSSDDEGVYFDIDGDGDTVLLSSDVVHIFFPASGSNSAGEDTRSVVAESENIVDTPEPGPLVLQGTGYLGLAILLYRKTRRPSLVSNVK
jgi:hypothetical protein